MSFSLIYICCSFRGGILSVVFPTVAICFWPAGNLECPCLFSDLILFPFLFLFFYIVPYPSFSSMFFSLIYICCSFRGGILSVVFPTVAICFWPAGNLECPCLFSDLILFPFLLLFFYIVPYPSFSSMSFSLIYICCSFRGGILSVVFPAVCFRPAGNLECPCLFSDLILFPFLLLFFYIVPYPSISSMSFLLIYSAVVSGRHSICCFPHCSHMFLTRREPGVPLSLFRPYPLPFSPPFLLYCSLPFLFSSMSFSLIYICCSFRGGILSVVFPTVAICFWPAGNLECPCLFSDLILFPFLLLFFYIVPYPSFSSCLFHWSISAVVSGGILSVVFPAVCFRPAGNLECPCLFSDLILFPFLLLFFYIVPYPSFSSMSFSLIYICCCFRGGILSAVFPAVAICFWPAGNLECPCLFSDLILFPFLLLFFYIVPYPSFSSMSFSLTYICCSFRGGILSAVFPTVAICFWPSGNLECPCLFSNLILFPFLLLFFYIVPYPSFSSMSFSLIYICCSLILFPFPLLFFYIVPYPSFSSMSMSFSLIYICCCFRGGILSVVFPL